MKIIKESLDVIDELDILREKLGDEIVLDQILEEINMEKLENFVEYMKRRYKSVLNED